MSNIIGKHHDVIVTPNDFYSCLLCSKTWRQVERAPLECVKQETNNETADTKVPKALYASPKEWQFLAAATALRDAYRAKNNSYKEYQKHEEGIKQYEYEYNERQHIFFEKDL